MNLKTIIKGLKLKLIGVFSWVKEHRKLLMIIAIGYLVWEWLFKEDNEQ